MNFVWDEVEEPGIRVLRVVEQPFHLTRGQRVPSTYSKNEHT
jgi:hypothetical protein